MAVLKRAKLKHWQEQECTVT